GRGGDDGPHLGRAGGCGRRGGRGRVRRGGRDRVVGRARRVAGRGGGRPVVRGAERRGADEQRGERQGRGRGTDPATPAWGGSRAPCGAGADVGPVHRFLPSVVDAPPDREHCGLE